MFMSLVDAAFAQKVQVIVAAHWNAQKDRGYDAPLGIGKVGLGAADLQFVVTTDALSGPGVLACKPVTIPDGGWALRLDEVAFPVGAVAHRHTHTGSGWRYLVSGALRIEAATSATEMTVGDSWFEPANTPVRAVALQDKGVTRFVRCMVIPQDDIGRSTFHLADPLDAELPRLQVTHRHLDEPV